MKKVAIMTWFHYHNFGTSLQVTALFNYVKNQGYETKVIQYIPHGRLVTLNGFRNPISHIKKITNKLHKKKKNIPVADEQKSLAFARFLDANISFTTGCEIDSELFALNRQFDAFICGSDQIWAPTVFNSKYFLGFVENSDKMISYAPSIGLSKVENKYVHSSMRNHIQRFKFLSIREEQGQELIKQMTNKDATKVLDPTFLLSANEWDNLAAYNEENCPYILCYFLGNNEKSWEHVRKLSEKTKLPLKLIPVYNNDLYRGFSVAFGVGPAEFLGLVKNAAFVCTDSFHGTVFSIIFERPFYTYERFSNKDINSQNTRIYNILNLIGLEGRLVGNKSIVCNNPLICQFTAAREIIAKEREKSAEYLIDSLNQSTNADKKASSIITNTCCGCGVCSVVCEQAAIKIELNNNGFFEAFINPDICLGCGSCSKVCPYNGTGNKLINKDSHNLYAIRSKQPTVLMKSSSGGAGFEISKALSEQGYDVIGCVYDKMKRAAEHQCVAGNEINKLDIFQGSKYLQSNCADTFSDFINKSKKAVIFGTPCQISGIDRLLNLKKKRDDFLLVDLICKGVPSYNLWQKYLKEGNMKYGYGRTPEVEFRKKSEGWRKKHILIQGNGKFYSCEEGRDSFYRLFLSQHCFLAACYECGYRVASHADIRLGDYWGPDYKHIKDGVSMVIAFNSAGEKVLQYLVDNGQIEMQKKNCEEYWRVQYPKNPIKPVFYEELLLDLGNESTGLRTISNKYCKEFEFNARLYKIYSKLSAVWKTWGKTSE